MPKLIVTTEIDAPIERCFDLARSIDLHLLSTSSTNESAVGGVTSGLIQKGETVTWQATHFGIEQRLTSKITAMDRPRHFRDEQIKGAFKSMTHDHWFDQRGEIVVMTDCFYFESPLGYLGKLFNRLVLKRYLLRFLQNRNEMLKSVAESDRWQELVL
jgi:ligand-binding SRPBCC domain-containing protein